LSAQDSIAPGATIQLIQGCEPGQGADFSGDMLYAIDFAGKGGLVQGIEFTPHTKTKGLGTSKIQSANSGELLVFPQEHPGQARFASMLRSHAWAAGRIQLQLQVKQGERYRLQFFWVESQPGLSAPGKRVFGVKLNGAPWIDDLDLSAVSGPLAGVRTNAVMGSGEWLATSDLLEIDLASSVKNPQLGVFTLEALSPSGLEVDKQALGGLVTVWDEKGFETEVAWPKKGDPQVANHVTAELKGFYPEGWQVLAGHRLGSSGSPEIAFGSPHLSGLAHPTCVISSPRFRLNPELGDIWVRLSGESGREVLPENLFQLPAYSSGQGCLGVGLRRVSDGRYVAMSGRSSLGTGVHRIPADVLASILAENPDELFRIDLVDSFHGSLGRVGLSGLWIPGDFAASEEERLAQQWLVYRRGESLVSSRSGMVFAVDSSISEPFFNEAGTAIRVLLVPEDAASSVREILVRNLDSRIGAGMALADSGVVSAGGLGLLQGFSGGEPRSGLRCLVVVAPAGNQAVTGLSIPAAVSDAPVGLQSWTLKPRSGPSIRFWLEFPARYHFDRNQPLQGLVLDAPFAANPETIAYSRDLGFTRNALRKGYVCMGWGAGIWNRHLWGVDSADLDEAGKQIRMDMWQTRCEDTEAEVARICQAYGLPEDGWIAMADCAAITRLTQYVSRYPHRFSTVLYEQAHTFAELNPASEHIFFGFISRKRDPYGNNCVAEFLRLQRNRNPVFYQQLDGGNQDIMINRTQFDLLDYVHQTREKLGIRFGMNATQRGEFATAVKQDLASAPWIYDIINQETFRNENIDWLPDEQRSGLPTTAIAASVHDGRPVRTAYGHALAKRSAAFVGGGEERSVWDVSELIHRPGMVEFVVEAVVSEVRMIRLFVDGKQVAQQDTRAVPSSSFGKGPKLPNRFHIPVLYRSKSPEILVEIESDQVGKEATLAVRFLAQHHSIPFQIEAGAQEVVVPVDAVVAEAGRYTAAISAFVDSCPSIFSAQLEFSGSGQGLAQDIHEASAEWLSMQNNVYHLTMLTPYDMAVSLPSLRIRFNEPVSADTKGVVLIGMQRHAFQNGRF